MLNSKKKCAKFMKKVQHLKKEVRILERSANVNYQNIKLCANNLPILGLIKLL